MLWVFMNRINVVSYSIIPLFPEFFCFNRKLKQKYNFILYLGVNFLLIQTSPPN